MFSLQLSEIKCDKRKEDRQMLLQAPVSSIITVSSILNLQSDSIPPIFRISYPCSSISSNSSCGIGLLNKKPCAI